jgi:hypothetical protein
MDSQKLINKQLTGLYDSLKRVSDSADFNRIKGKIDYLHFRFDSLSKELNKLETK